MIMRAAGCEDDKPPAGIAQPRQRLDHDKVVLVRPELVGQQEIVALEPVATR